MAWWYLITPPKVDWGRRTDAPLYQWNHAGAFQTAKECEHKRGEKLRNAGDEATYLTFFNAQCVPSDDPRLVGGITPLRGNAS